MREARGEHGLDLWPGSAPRRERDEMARPSPAARSDLAENGALGEKALEDATVDGTCRSMTSSLPIT